MEVVAENVGNLFFLNETILHIPVNGRNGYTQKLRMALVLILSNFNLQKQIGFYEKSMDLFKYLFQYCNYLGASLWPICFQTW